MNKYIYVSMLLEKKMKDKKYTDIMKAHNLEQTHLYVDGFWPISEIEGNLHLDWLLAKTFYLRSI